METGRAPLTPEQLRRLRVKLESAWGEDDCPDDDLLLAYAADRLTAAERAVISSHLDTCEACREEVEEWRREWSSLFAQNGEPSAELKAFQDKMRQALYRLSDEEPTAASPVSSSQPGGEPGVAFRIWQSIRQLILGGDSRRGVVLAEASMIAILLAVVGYQAGRLAERDSAAATQIVELQTRALVRAVMLENLSVLNAWGVSSSGGSDSQAIAASLRNFDLVQLPRSAGGAYTLPTLLQVRGEASALGSTLDRDAGLRAEVDDYSSRFSTTLLALSDLLVETGKVEQARKLFAYLRREHPEDVANWFAEGEMRKLEQDHTGAIALYEEMIQRGMATTDPRPYHFAGYSYSVLDNFDQALKYYKRALEISPNYAKVYYNVAQLYRQKSELAPGERDRLYDENLKRAIATTEQAYQTTHDTNPRVTFTLSILHAGRKGATKQDRESALDFLKRALQRERSYVLRAQSEPAFEFFRDLRNEPYHTRFQELLDQYRPRSSQFGARQGSYDPKVFVE